MDPEKIRLSIIDCEKKAAGLVLHAGRIIALEKTDRRDVVTEYDVNVQKLLTEELHAVLPEAHFFCEESRQDEDPRIGEVFIIDPIDGTMNFVHSMSCSAISVAYAKDGVVLAGAVYNPFLDEMFSASYGNGAYLNGTRIHAASESLAESLVCFGSSPYNTALTHKTFALAEKSFNAALDVRRTGSAAVDSCTVAAGRAGAYFEYQLSYWDYAAGAFIAREAGALTSDINGNPLPNDGSKTSVVITSAAAHDEFFRLINE